MKNDAKSLVEWLFNSTYIYWSLNSHGLEVSKLIWVLRPACLSFSKILYIKNFKKNTLKNDNEVA